VRQIVAAVVNGELDRIGQMFARLFGVIEKAFGARAIRAGAKTVRWRTAGRIIKLSDRADGRVGDRRRHDRQVGAGDRWDARAATPGLAQVRQRVAVLRAKFQFRRRPAAPRPIAPPSRLCRVGGGYDPAVLPHLQDRMQRLTRTTGPPHDPGVMCGESSRTVESDRSSNCAPNLALAAQRVAEIPRADP
jgi:hypothetical protein